MTMIGPLTGADARAKRHPPTAASVVPSAARKMMKVKRRGRDTRFGSGFRGSRFSVLGSQFSFSVHPRTRTPNPEPALFLQLLDDRLRLRRFLRGRVGGDHFLERLDRRVLVAFVQLHERELE